jgi:Carbamoyl-phosphate synthase L chain, ATP binding domain
MGKILSKPTVLLAATDRWYPTARLGMALASAGCIVDALCPSGHPLGMTNVVRRTYDYNGLRPLTSLDRAIRNGKPDLVIPADDMATWHLHDLHQEQSSSRDSRNELCKLIERSLGPAESFKILRARSAFMKLAEETGVRVPHTAVIEKVSDLHDWIARTGFPVVLKANGTSGGDGVRVVGTVEEAERGLLKLQAPPLLARAIKRTIVDRDLKLVWPSLSRRRRVVNAQTFVAGREATSAIACWEGKVVASLHFEVLQKVGTTGHATVVRRIEHPEMTAAAEKIAHSLRLSGLHGLDFMLESETGKAHLIEINPRTTQVGHLSLGLGHDLPAALYAAITGNSLQPAAKITENNTIALFPQEWKRDPESPFLVSAYHDVPWQEPAMVASCLGSAQKSRRGSQKVPLPQRHSAPEPSKAGAVTSQAAH